ncbi:thiamine ABC transporter substrate binding subunit [Cardiobacteriales bacterium ML27]|uniref:Thiamine-binding periplasmic protein n=2 Tax=Ostreibacterium oceani TaxID=2654998 RepID=A0A6N7F1A4_9GAMM|nr:thiamine ABC transporter substrate binding subunit [Ostreibacterium oceani]
MRLGLICLLFLQVSIINANTEENANDNVNNSNNNNTLDIYTYSSFVQGGITEAVTPLFEKQCQCEVKYHHFGDAQSILTRLKIEGERSIADLVIGLDQNLMGIADAAGLFVPHQIDNAQLTLPIAWDSSVYLPFDYGYFAFVYDQNRLTDVPQSFDALADSDIKIIIQDPRTSSPGLGLLLWIKAAYGDKAPSIWQRLSDNVVTTTRGWSEAYGLFLKGESDMVLSYTTSPFYHHMIENDSQYQAATFTAGHYLQVEVAAIPKHSQAPELANAFLQFMLSEAFQQEIPTSNWMYPVVDIAMPPIFSETAKPMSLPLLDTALIESERRNWIDEWLNAL